mmetsp:Transcript_71379/g.206678  ORF Transcript_71379/g.206678 Transcript_71379/m.206678 type:complete len:232 (-) Transcript_71379:624-1319(-)
MPDSRRWREAPELLLRLDRHRPRFCHASGGVRCLLHERPLCSAGHHEVDAGHGQALRCPRAGRRHVGAHPPVHVQPAAVAPDVHDGRGVRQRRGGRRGARRGVGRDARGHGPQVGRPAPRPHHRGLLEARGGGHGELQGRADRGRGEAARRGVPQRSGAPCPSPRPELGCVGAGEGRHRVRRRCQPPAPARRAPGRVAQRRALADRAPRVGDGRRRLRAPVARGACTRPDH